MPKRKTETSSPARRPTLRIGEVQGQGAAIDFLRRAWRDQRLAHAYFFVGPSGIGKRATASALALGLHCETTPFDACGTCAACRTIAAGTHPDVRVLDGPAGDKRDISIEQVRTLQRELAYRSLSTRPKVGIVDDAHLLTVQAQNALLKTLEEPTGDSLLILVGATAAGVVPTILSRCQRVAFRPLANDVVTAILGAHGLTPSDAGALAAYAEGSPGAALALDREFFAVRRPRILAEVAALHGAEAKCAVDLAQRLIREDKNLVPVLTIIASWYRDSLRRAILGPTAPVLNADVTTTSPPLDAATSLRNLEATYATIHALRHNANRNLALTDMLLRVST